MLAIIIIVLFPDGSDYIAVAPRSLIFDRNNSEFHIAINILDDQFYELNEDFFGHLSTADGDVVLQPQETRVLIVDNDGMQQTTFIKQSKLFYLNTVVTFTFRQPVYMFMEDVGTGRVCVDKIGNIDQTITVIVNGGMYMFLQYLIVYQDVLHYCMQPLSQDPSIAC